jgi:hypothetical protein
MNVTDQLQEGRRGVSRRVSLGGQVWSFMQRELAAPGANSS